MSTVYTTNPSCAKTRLVEPGRRTSGIRKQIQTLKAEIAIEDYLRRRGVEPRRGRARCIVHGGNNPTSFSIDPERQRWQCFSCGERGDLIDLCELVDRHADTWTAVVALSIEFGVDLPEKPKKWRERQDEKGQVREAVKRNIARRYQRRLVRLYAPIMMIGGESPEEELEALEELASVLWPRCLVLAERRVSGRE
jgi:DNA primase